MSTRKIFKVVVVGEGNVGKTTLVRGYVDQVLAQNTIPTIGVDLSTKIIPQEGYDKLLQIWDLGGQAHLRFVAQIFFRGASGMMAVFDVTRKQSLLELDGWIERVYQVTGRIPSVVVGNKIDLRSVAGQNGACVTREEGEEFALEHDAPYVETSAKAGSGIEEAFTALASKLD
jgi:Ras-related protein Rab-18